MFNCIEIRTNLESTKRLLSPVRKNRITGNLVDASFKEVDIKRQHAVLFAAIDNPEMRDTWNSIRQSEIVLEGRVNVSRENESMRINT